MNAPLHSARSPLTPPTSLSPARLLLWPGRVVWRERWGGGESPPEESDGAAPTQTGHVLWGANHQSRAPHPHTVFEKVCRAAILTHLSPLSLKKLELLRVCGLTTLAHRDELLARKRRKRRRMMRERSLSPPATRGKRKASSPPTPPAPLTTPYSAEQMDSTPELREKKDFLLMFDLSHVSPQQRRGNGLLHSHTHAAHVLLCSFCTVVVVKNTTCSCILFTQGVGVGEKKIKFVCTWRGGRGRSFVFLLQE